MKKYKFPYARLYLPPAEDMFENLKKYKPSYLYEKYVLGSYWSPNKLYLPPLFKNKYITIICNHQSYHTLDGITDWFTEKIRISSSKKEHVSTIERWNDPDFVNKMIDQTQKQLEKRHEEWLNDQQLSVKLLRENIYNEQREPGLFKITWAIPILNIIYGTRDLSGLRWLDISAGWGDRLITSILMGCSYLGFDPNTKLGHGHDNIIAKFGNPYRHRVIYEPFENVNLDEEELFDFCFSSPPFFDSEIYIGENQSIDKYPQFEDWMVSFLFASLKKAWSKLKTNGYLIIHMGDPWKVSISEPMNLFIEQYLLNSDYIGVIGVIGDRGKSQPVWVWKKITDYARNTIPRYKSQKPPAISFYPEIFKRV